MILADRLHMPHLVLVFRRPVFVSDKILAVYAGKLMHVDIMPIYDSVPENTITYTSYVSENFSMSISTKRLYTNERCVARAIPVTSDEFDRAVSFLHDLCEAEVPYNYADLLLTAMPHMLQTAFIDDVPSENPKDLTSVYCSQAAVLCLRAALGEDSPLLAEMREINSRLTLPLDLYHHVLPYSTGASCDDLQRGVIIPFSTDEVF